MLLDKDISGAVELDDHVREPYGDPRKANKVELTQKRSVHGRTPSLRRSVVRDRNPPFALARCLSDGWSLLPRLFHLTLPTPIDRWIQVVRTVPRTGTASGFANGCGMRWLTVRRCHRTLGHIISAVNS
ncbi:hypothetical protein CI238_02387 [Colletotrichum incanum]|uniref:Uncharacterized protein n=1 Tax=Colletotrichum incanum TaxID=1573173 RepID=A0A167AB01_COLIC|nr:hypothetical protein CI238_02387 [Colletotrichum incanum]OHX01045.1 hypothetical protein CSPAE12_00093 [Colletotrichum incanum]